MIFKVLFLLSLAHRAQIAQILAICALFALASPLLAQSTASTKNTSATNDAGQTLDFSDQPEGAQFIQFEAVLDLADAVDPAIAELWQALPHGTMQDVFAIHSGAAPFNGNGPAYDFYESLQLSVLKMGEAEYVENSLKDDDLYTAAELQEYWAEFSEHFSAGVDSDLDYTAKYAPEFSQILVSTFPKHPLSSELMIEIDTFRKNEYVREKNEYVREKNEYVREKNAEIERKRETIEALDRLNRSLEGLNTTLSGQ
jgi:hypothetical protein